jgi:hypothetical protein
MMRQFKSRAFVHAEHLDGEAAHRARHPIAIQIQGGKVGRDNIFATSISMPSRTLRKSAA